MVPEFRALTLTALLAVSALAQPARPALDPPPDFTGNNAQALERVQQELAKRQSIPPGSIRVTVTDSATGPLTITLASTNNRPDLTRTTTTNAQGEFELKNLAPGSYNAYAWPSSDPRLPALAGFRALFQPIPVTIANNPATLELNAITPQQLNEALARY